LGVLADNLAASIPFCLGMFKLDSSSSPICPTSITIISDEEVKPCLVGAVEWPLTIAASLEAIDMTQQLWFRSELASLGRISGDGVLECAETDQWAML